MGLIYEMDLWQKTGRMVVSTQNLAFINVVMSGGYDQISRQVSALVRKFLSWPELVTSVQHSKSGEEL